MKSTNAIFAYPTESFYALGVQATNPKEIRQLFRVKHREPKKPVALIAANLKQVEKFFVVRPAERKLMKKYWPAFGSEAQARRGALTILLKPKKAIAGKALGAKKIGVRVPAHTVARRLAADLGAPITATSANISGQPPTKSAAKVKRDFPGILIVPGRCGRQRQPSTVVEMTGHQIKILRHGSVHI